MRYLLLLLALFAASFVHAATTDAPQGEAIGSKTLTMPTQNTDGSQLTDLAKARLYWAFTLKDYDISRTSTYDSTVAGATQPAPFVISLIASVGDVVSVFFVATAIDVNGGESAFSNEVIEQFLVVDSILPMPPGLVFDVPYIIDVHNTAGEKLGVVSYRPLASL